MEVCRMVSFGSHNYTPDPNCRSRLRGSSKGAQSCFCRVQGGHCAFVTPKWLHRLCLMRRANVRDPSDKRSEAGLDPDFMARVHHVLETEVLKGRCSAASVAHLFTIDRRTLNRRLNAQGTAYRQVANRVRFDIACRLLADPGMTIAQVAARLKFSEPSAFTHAFRRWSGGQTPSAWRAQHCQGALTSSRRR